MAKYTIELKDIVSSYRIFNFSYPFHDEKQRADFEKAFIRHFYFREICCPTIDRFLVYLEDKMNTVFPYYNELLKTATIKYDVENPYNLTETYKRKTDTSGKTNGVSSAVGQVLDNGTSKTNDSQKIEKHDEGTATASSNQETASNKQGSGETERNGREVKKFLDTPQGKLSLSDDQYLTSLNDDTNDVHEGVSSSENASSSTTASSSSSESSNGRQQLDGESNVATENERRTTDDSNVRSESVGNEIEEYTLTRKGNIGVNPASYEIDSHIKTQKTLQNIYKMFFDDCEDLFMMVY